MGKAAWSEFLTKPCETFIEKKTQAFAEILTCYPHNASSLLQIPAQELPIHKMKLICRKGQKESNCQLRFQKSFAKRQIKWLISLNSH